MMARTHQAGRENLRRRALFVAAAAFMLIQGCNTLKLGNPIKVGTADWPTFAKVGARTNATEERLTSPLSLKWEQEISGGVGNGSPVIVDSILIIGNLRGELYGINTHTGKRIGWIDLGEAIQGSPVIDDNVAIVAVANSRESLIAFDLIEGKALWKREYGDIEVSPLLAGNRIYIGTTEGTMYCVERSKGDSIWRFDLPNNTRHKGIRSSPANEGSNVVFGAEDGVVYSLDGATGAVRWTYDTGGSIVAAPAIKNGTVYIGNLAGGCHAIDLESGKRQWHISLGEAIYASASLAESLVVIGNIGGRVTALHSADGTVLWSTNLGGAINAGGVISGNLLYIGTLKKELFAIALADGSVQWKQTVDGRIKTSPAIVDGTLYVATDERLVLAFQETPR